MSASFPASSRPDSPEGVGRRAGTRPTLVVGLLAGVAAALLGLVVCGSVGLVGWYLSDAGSHGAPRDGVAVGVRGWLVAHGAGLQVDGVEVTLLPLALTLGLAWLVWQAGLRLGELVWDHGPDEARRGDGERDFTLARAIGGFGLGYVGTALVAAATAGDGQEGSTGAVLRWALLLVVVLAAPAVALGAGRAQAWIERSPVVLRDAFGGAGRLLVAWLAVSAVVFLVALALGVGEARAVVDRLGTSGAESLLLTLGCLLLVPQAVLWSSSFLLGPGFTVGTGTVVAPSGVLLGPVPLLPILAALPDEGEVAGFWAAHLVVPALVAAWIVGRRHARVGLVRWEGSLVAGAGAGVIAAVLLALLTALADGSAGPGRLAHVGAAPGEVLLAALPPFVLGGLAGAALGTWWTRRRAQPEAADASEDHAGSTAPEAGPDAGSAGQVEQTVSITPRTPEELAAAKAAATGVGTRPPSGSTLTAAGSALAAAAAAQAGDADESLGDREGAAAAGQAVGDGAGEADASSDTDTDTDADADPDEGTDDLDATQEVVLGHPGATSEDAATDAAAVPDEAVPEPEDDPEGDTAADSAPAEASTHPEAEAAVHAQTADDVITPELDPDLEVTAEVVLGVVVSDETASGTPDDATRETPTDPAG